MSASEDKEGWQSLTGHPQWKEIEQFAAEQVASRTALLIQGCETRREEDLLRGEILGIGLFVQYPKTLIEVLSVDVDNENQE